jgi:hypothetical protein
VEAVWDWSLLSNLDAILDFGAVADARTLNTQAVQAARDAAAAKGGGRVVVPAGTYLVGTVFLRDHVELHLEQGARLLGSPGWFLLSQAAGQKARGAARSQNPVNPVILSKKTAPSRFPLAFSSGTDQM